MGDRMNFYQFIKSIRDGIGEDCKVVALLWEPKFATGLEIHIALGELRCIFVVLESQLENEMLLSELSKHIIRDTNRKFSLLEIGEE